MIYAISFNGKSNFTITGSWEDYPKGCSIYDNGNMYFNSHPMGSRDSNARSICMIGKELFKDSVLFKIVIIRNRYLAIIAIIKH